MRITLSCMIVLAAGTWLATPAAGEQRSLYACPKSDASNSDAAAADRGERSCPAGNAPDLGSAPSDLPLTWTCAPGRSCTIQSFMADNRVCVLMVMQHGKPVLAVFDNSQEKCGNGQAPNAPDRAYGLASMTKSLTSLLFGLANNRLPPDRKIDLTKPVGDYFAAMAGPRYDRVTVSHVLTMASGLAWDDDRHEGKLRDSAIDDARNPGSLTLMQAAAAALGTPGTPGRFSYSALDTTLLAIVASSRLAETGDPQPPATLPDALEAWLWQQAGMQDPLRWKGDRVGVPAPWCCAYAAPRDLLRLGQWVLENRRPGAALSGWLTESSRLHHRDARSCRDGAGEERRLGYGFQWWVFQHPDRSEPHPLMGFTALGKGGQFLHIAPAADAVILQLSDWSDRRGGWSDRRACQSYALHQALLEHLTAQP